MNTVAIIYSTSNTDPIDIAGEDSCEDCCFPSQLHSEAFRFKVTGYKSSLQLLGGKVKKEEVTTPAQTQHHNSPLAAKASTNTTTVVTNINGYSS